MSWLLVAVGAAVGAPTRYLVDRAVQQRHSSQFPLGTLAVNVVGSLILGLVTGVGLTGAGSHDLALLLGVGFCGALTTYSAFGYETFRLVETGAVLQAATNVTISVLAGLGAAALGVATASALWG